MPIIRLPDGSERSFENAVTVADVAASIGAGLARAALAGKVNGTLVDTSYLIEANADLAIITERDAEGVDIIRHSTAHLLAYAVKELFPDAQVTILFLVVCLFITNIHSIVKYNASVHLACQVHRDCFQL